METYILGDKHENKETYILGDLNCDLLKSIPDHPTKTLKSLLEIYQLSQIIDKATRITRTSSTLIDHFITNEPGKISKCGVNILELVTIVSFMA